MWFDGKVGCILVGNVGKVLGGVEAFDDVSPEDGLLELGVITAKGVTQWTRTLVRTAVGSADRSKFVQTTKAKKIKIKLKYNGRKGVIAGLKKVSKPGLRRYVGATEIPRVLNGMGISIVSTPKGVMTGNQARKENVGGELVAFVW